VRGLGTSLVLIALVAVQVPFVTCHSDCRSDYLHLFAFDGHHCHDRVEVVHEHVHRCPCEHTHPVPAEDGEDHAPGDHEIVYAVVGTPPTAPALAWDQAGTLEVLLVDVALAPSASVATALETRSAGPPTAPALETVRLLL
jgi:hypothetical protein